MEGRGSRVISKIPGNSLARPVSSKDPPLELAGNARASFALRGFLWVDGWGCRDLWRVIRISSLDRPSWP